MTIPGAIKAFAGRSVSGRHALQLLLYSAGIAGLLLLAAWICDVEHARAARYPELYDAAVWDTLALADIFSVLVLGAALLVIVPAAVATTVAGEQRSGTLEQLRTTPIQPLGLLLGLVLGAPARLYLLCAGPLALHLACSLAGHTPPEVVIGPVVVMAVGGLAFSLTGAAIGLAQSRERGAMLTLGLAGFFAGSGLLACALAQHPDSARWSFLHPAGAVYAQLLTSSELWQHVVGGSWSWYVREYPGYTTTLGLLPPLAVAFFGAVAAVLARAGCRKVARPELPLLSKVQALALFGLTAAAVVLPNLLERALPADQASARVLACFALLLPVMGILAAFASPGRDLWSIALRRGRRLGLLDDDAPPHRLVWIMIAALFCLCCVAFWGAGFPHQLQGHHLGALLWMLVLAATLPCYVLFGLTRFTSHRARTAYALGIIAHLALQAVAISFLNVGIFAFQQTVLFKAALLLGLAVPAWIIWRQRVLRRATEV